MTTNEILYKAAKMLGMKVVGTKKNWAVYISAPFSGAQIRMACHHPAMPAYIAEMMWVKIKPIMADEHGDITEDGMGCELALVLAESGPVEFIKCVMDNMEDKC